MEDIIIREVYRSFGEKEVLHGFSARLQAGTITGLMAPSGSGKTTLLRILMGLDRPQRGEITGLDGLRVSAVFQEDRLCENLNAAANIRLVTPTLTLETVEASLQAVGLGDSSRQPVRELSGGQKRRVAILRALLAQYDLLLLDEPVRGLDAATKQVVLTDTPTRCAGQTVLLVTHDPEELDAMGVTNRLSL